MPGMSGLEVLQMARQAYGRAVRVGMITTEASPELLRQAHSSGADFILPKPFDDAELSLRVRQVLADKPAAPPQPVAEAAADAKVETGAEAGAETGAEAKAEALTEAKADAKAEAPASLAEALQALLASRLGSIKFRLVEQEPIAVEALSPKVLLCLISVPGVKAAYALALMDSATACMIGGGARAMLPSQVRPLIAAHAPTEEMTALATAFVQEAANALVAPGSERPRMSRGNWVARDMDKLVVALSNNTQLHGFRLQVSGYGEGRMAFILL